MSQDLIFAGGSSTTPPIDLVFGAEGGSAIVSTLTADIGLPDMESYGTNRVVQSIAGDGTLPSTDSAGSTQYDSRTTRYLGDFVGAKHQPADLVRKNSDFDWDVTQRKEGYTGDGWEPASAEGLQVGYRHQVAARVDESGSVKWTPADRRSAGAGVRHQRADSTRNEYRSPFSRAVKQAQVFASGMQPGLPVRMVLEVSDWQKAIGGYTVYAGSRLGWSPLHFTRGLTNSRWQPALPVGPSYRPVVVVPPTSECYTPSGVLLFKETWALVSDLLFLCDNHGGTNPDPDPDPGESQVVIPVRKVYFVLNSMSLKRVSNNTQIKVKAVEVSTDMDTWAWGFSAMCPKSELAAINPISGPVEVELELNGYVWRFLVEELTETRKFGDTSYRISGRSLTAQLDDPYMLKHSYVQTETLQSRQLVDAVLARPDVPTGFTVDWSLGNAFPTLGWEMPAGTYSYADKTPMQAIKELVEGVKGFVNSHPRNKQLKVRSRYPLMPWELAAATADVEIPHSVARMRGVQLRKSPEYNGVYMRGEATGKFGFVKRLGTAGETIPPLYVNKALSADDAIREAGKYFLSACGVRSYVDLGMPLLDNTGLITPGKLISVVDGGLGEGETFRGFAQGLKISAAWDETLSITQTVSIERRHLV